MVFGFGMVLDWFGDDLAKKINLAKDFLVREFD